MSATGCFIKCFRKVHEFEKIAAIVRVRASVSWKASRFLQPSCHLDAIISQIYFWNKTPHVSDSSSIHHQKFFTVHNSNGICHTGLLTACEQDRTFRPDPALKLVHLVGFIIRIFHDTRSPER